MFFVLALQKSCFLEAEVAQAAGHSLANDDVIVTSVAFALQQTLEVAQEPSGTFPFPAKPESNTTDPRGRLYCQR